MALRNLSEGFSSMTEVVLVFMVMASVLVAWLVWAWKSPERLVKFVCAMLAIRLAGYAFDLKETFPLPKPLEARQHKLPRQQSSSSVAPEPALLAYPLIQSIIEAPLPSQHSELVEPECLPSAVGSPLQRYTSLTLPCLALEDGGFGMLLETRPKSYSSFLTPVATSLPTELSQYPLNQ
jgi:hypothetical protein